jgi:hypothetical protein
MPNAEPGPFGQLLAACAERDADNATNPIIDESL